MKVIRKTTVCLFALALIFGLGTSLPRDFQPVVTAYAAEAETDADLSAYGDFTYRLINNGTQAEIAGYTGSGGAVAIPDKINGKPVVSIGERAFYSCDTISEVKIPDSVKTIGEAAFAICRSLAKIDLGNGVTSIGKEAFFGGMLTQELTIPDSVQTIGDNAFVILYLKHVTIGSGLKTIAPGAFRSCPYLTEINIPDNVTAIGDEAFYGCGALKKVVIGKGVASISQSAFRSCNALEEIVVSEQNAACTLADGVLYNKAQTNLILAPKAGLSEHTIPDTVEEISDYAFENCAGLTKITFGSGLQTIDDYAFYGCKMLGGLNLPSGLQAIGDGAFGYCTAINELDFPDSLNAIGRYTFSGCSALENIAFNSGLQTIGDRAFYGCKMLGGLNLPSGLQTIGENAFNGCVRLSEVNIPAELASLDPTAFSGCTAVEKFTADEGSAAYSAVNGVLFNKARTKLLLYPKGKNGAYVTPNTVTEICECAFDGCTGLTEITIGGSVRIINARAFNNCAALTDVRIKNGVAEIGEYAFNNCDKLIGIAFPTGVKTIGDYAFCDCNALASLSLGDGVQTIGKYAFYKSALQEVKIPDNVRTIGDYSFYNCAALEALDLGRGVTEIGGYAFYDCDKLTEVIIPDSVQTLGSAVFKTCSALQKVNLGKGVQTIGAEAFYNCYKLTEMTIPDSVQTIGSYAFRYCSGLQAMTLGGSVQSIGAYAFDGCKKLTEVTIPDSVQTIDKYAFNGCALLQRVAIGRGVTEMPTNVFDGCTVLEEVTVSEANEAFSAVDGVLFDKAGTKLIFCPKAKAGAFVVPNTVTEICDSAFSGCKGITEITIGGNVKRIGANAFSGCSGLASVEIKNGVEIIDEAAFNRCSVLKAVSLPDSLKTIGAQAFYYCSGLETLDLGSGVQTIGDGAFNSCSMLKALVIPDSLQTIGAQAFYYCSGLETLDLGSGVQTIGNYAFSGCKNLTEVTIPDSVTELGENAFAYCSALKKAVIGKGVTVIYASVFSGCSALEELIIDEANEEYALVDGVLFNRAMTKIILYPKGKAGDYVVPDTVTEICDSAFENCAGLTGITIGGNVKTIGANAFQSCSALTSVEIKNGVEIIDEAAFNRCTALKAVRLPDSLKTIGAQAFYYCSGLETLDFGSGLKTIGNNAFESCSGLTELIIPDSVQAIGDNAFKYCSGLQQLTLGSGLKTIGNNAFESCSGLTELTIPDGVETIGESAFSGCYYLKQLTLGNSVQTIGSYAFCNSTSITELVIPDSVQTIGGYAFSRYGNRCSLQQITFGSGVREIGEAAFYGCINLKELKLPDSLKTVGNCAFVDCYGIETLDLGNGLTVIGDYAFADYYNLTELTIPDSVQRIGSGAFSSLSSITELTIPDSVQVIGNDAFCRCSALKKVTIGKSVTAIDLSVFSYDDAVEEFVVSEDSITLSAFNGALLDKAQTKLILYPKGKAGDYVIPDSVTEIGGEAFKSANALTGIIIGSGVRAMGNDAFYDCTALTHAEIKNGATVIGAKAFYNCSKLEMVNIPDSVTDIGESAFANCTALTQATVGGVRTMGDNVFKGCAALTRAEIKDGAAVIGVNAFCDCNKLETVIIGGVKTIGAFAFYSCDALANLSLGEGIETIGSDAFNGCRTLKAVAIPDSVKSIGGYSFYNCSAVETLNLGSGTTSIGDYAFYGCAKPIELIIPDSVQTIGNAAFSACTGLQKLTLGSCVTSIGSSAFSGCANLTELTIPDSVQTIGEKAFFGCDKLTQLTVPDSVISIGSNAFSGISLKKISLGKGVKDVDAAAFYNCRSIEEIELSAQSENLTLVDGVLFNKAMTKLALCPRRKTGDYVIPDSVTEIGECAFLYCSGLKSIVIGGNVQTIDPNAFAYCSGLKSITIGGNVQTIGSNAFTYCSGLKSITIGSGVRTMGINAFKYCTGLTDVEIKNGLEAIPEGAFYSCSKLESVIIPASVKTIGKDAFYFCNALYGLSLSEGLETISENAFYNCDALVKVEIPDTVKTLKKSAFSSCYKLAEIDFGSGVTSIGNSAFGFCDSLTKVEIPDNVLNIYDYAFDDCNNLKKLTFGSGLTYVASNAFAYSPVDAVYCYSGSYGYTAAQKITGASIYYIQKQFEVTDLQIAELNTRTVTLTWKKPRGYSNIKEYIIYRNDKEVGRSSVTTYKSAGIDEGEEYIYAVAAVDSNGNVSDKTTISVKPACPEVQSITVPNDVFRTDGVRPLRLTAAMKDSFGFTDGVGEFYYSADSENWKLIAEARPLGTRTEYVAEWNLSKLPEGAYTVKFVFTEIYGATSELTANVCVDRTPPEEIVNFAVYPDVASIKMSWSIAKEADVRGYRVYRRAEDESEFSIVSDISGRSRLNFEDKAVTENAVYEYYVVSVDVLDREGERGEVIRASLNEDVAPARVTGLVPANGESVRGLSKFSVTAQDNAGVTKIELYYSADKTDWKLLDSAEAAGYSKYLDTTAIPDGVYYYKALAYDKAGNVSNGTPVYSFKVDNTAPEKVSGAKADNITAGTATLCWQDVAAKDFDRFVVEIKNPQTGVFSECGNAQTTLGINLSGLTPNTEYTYRVAAYDKIGNRGAYSDEIIFTTLSDTTAPAVTKILPKPGYFNKKIPLEITVQDDIGAASVLVQVSQDLKTWNDVFTKTFDVPAEQCVVSCDLDTTSYADGGYYVRAIVTDTAGNKSASGSDAPYSQYMVDRTAPSVPTTLQAIPADGAIELRWTQENSDCASYDVYRSASPDGKFTLLKTISSLNCFDCTVDPTVTYYYKLAAKDIAGNTSGLSAAVSAKMEKDTIPPQIMSIKPANNSVVGGDSHTVSVLVSDNNRIASVEIQYKTTGDYITLFTKENINSGYDTVEAELPLENLQDGEEITVRALATDYFGNKNNADNKIAVYTVDKTAPAVSQLTADCGEDSVTLSWVGAGEADFGCYRVYRKADVSGKEELLTSTLGTSYTDSATARGEVYYYRVEAVDKVGNTASAESGKLGCTGKPVVGNAAPVAVLNVPAVMEAGVEYIFDASGSYDETAITAYNIDFGDGESADAEQIVHSYAAVGEYTVTLTVKDNDGNVTVLTQNVVVAAREAIGKVNVTVKMTNGTTMPYMPVYYYSDGGKPSVTYTQSDGSVTFSAVVGRIVVGTYDDGYLPVKEEIIVTNGDTTRVELVVVRQPIVTGEFEVKRMTLDEIIAAGIDPYEPENQSVTKIDVILTYDNHEIDLTWYQNSDGNNCGGTSSTTYGGRSFTANYDGKSNTCGVVDVPTDVSFLKDFFNVKLHIVNQAAPEFSLVDNTVSLDVPDGLTVMEANGRSASPNVHFDEIKGQETVTACWMLRGDVPGKYGLEANFTGTLSEFNAPVSAKFISKDKFEVRDGTGLEVLLDASKTLFRGNSYFDVGMHNIDREDTYIPDINVEDAVLRWIEFEDASGARRAITADQIPSVLNKGETLWKRYYKAARGDLEPNQTLQKDLGDIAKKRGIPLRLTSFPIEHFISYSEMHPIEYAEPSTTPGTFCVKVIDATTNLPVQGAKVIADKGEMGNDENGKGEFKTNSSGIAILKLSEDNTLAKFTVMKEGYDPVGYEDVILPTSRMATIFLHSNVPEAIPAPIPTDRARITGGYVEILGKVIPLIDIDGSVELPSYLETMQRVVDTENMKIQYTIGVGMSESASPEINDPEWKECFSGIKDIVDNYSTNGSQSVNNALSKLRGKMAKTAPNLGFSCDAKCVGYIEFSYATGRLEIVSSGLLIGANVGCSLTYRPAPFPPAYIKLSLTGGIEGKFDWTVVDNNIDFNGLLTLGITSGVGIGLGIDGIANVEAGLEGEINGQIELPFKNMPESFKLSLGGRLYVKASALIFGTESSCNIGPVTLYPPTSKTPKALASFDKNDLEMMPRDYLTRRPSKQLRSLTGQNASYYQANVFPYGDPKLIELDGGKQLLVWVGDDASRSDANRTQLYYSVYDGTSWSGIQTVCDDGTADFAPRLCRDGDKVYLLWQNLSGVMSDSVTYDEMAQAMNLSLAVFDGVSFSDPMTVNDDANTIAETMHGIAAKNGAVSVVWLENSENDPFLLSGTNSVYRKTLVNGEWQTKECFASGITTVTDLSVGYNGDECVVAYALDADGDAATKDDIQIYLVGESAEECVTQPDTYNTGMQLVGGALYWNQDGVWMMRKDGKTTVLGLNAPTDAVILENGADKAAIWKQVDGCRNDLNVSYLGSDGEWTAPLPLTNDNGNFRSLCAVMKANGEIAYACNWSSVPEVIPEDCVSPYGPTDLIVMQGNINCDLCLDGGAAYDDADVKPGQLLPLTVNVRNNSLKNIANADICITDENGVKALSQTVACNLGAGENKDINLSLTLPQTLTKHELTVTVTPAGLTDSDLSNNTAVLSVGTADLALPEITFERSGDDVTLHGVVTNAGYDVAKNVKAVVYADGAYGEQLAEVAVGDVAPGASAQLYYKLPADKCAFADETGRRIFYVKIVSDSEEGSYANNSASKLLEALLAQSVCVDRSIFNLNVGDRVTVHAQAAPENAVNKTFAWVSDNTDVATVDGFGQITAVGNGSANIAVITTNGITANVKVNVGADDFTMVMKYNSAYSVFNGEKLQNTIYSTGFAAMTSDRGTSMLPVRFLCEVTGMQVDWNAEKHIVTVTNPQNGEYLTMTINSLTVARYDVNGEKTAEWQLAIAPKIVNGVTMVPLRAVSECLGYYVEYSKKDYGSYVIISGTPQTENVDALCESAKALGI